MNNFDFLKTVDKNLYDIISCAEKLYRDEYFEQCIGQTRRFGENVCKNVLGNARTNEKTFDDMLATLKDKVSTVIQEKEFVDDLYFLKREGNASVHAGKVKNDGIIALECLQRAFEVAINYAVYYKKTNSNLLKLQFDTEMLITGEKIKKNLVDKYQEEKAKIKKKNSPRKNSKKTKKIVYNKENKISLYWIFVGISGIITFALIISILVLAIV